MGSRSKTFIFVVVLCALVEYPEDHIDDPWLATDRKRASAISNGV